MSSASPTTVREVIEGLRQIEVSAPRTDGVVCFARLYRQVTEGVQAELAGRTFADPQFLARLDVCFAGLFFSALDAYGNDPDSTPSAWAPLFLQRSRRGIAPLQFALAGMNAHINRDLPVALVSTARESDVELCTDSPEHGDYLQIDALLAQVEARVRASYVSGWLARIDRVVHRLDRIDDVAAMWDVDRARDAAWTNAEALYALRDDQALSGEFLLTLDRMVGLATRGLLIPADSILHRLARDFHIPDRRLGPDLE